MHRPARPRPPPGILYRPNARSATIKRLIERLTAERGTVPTDAELGALLAISRTRVRRHRALLKL